MAFDQSLAPVHDSALGYQFVASVARVLGRHGLLKTLASDQPADQDHTRLLKTNAGNLKRFFSRLTCPGAGKGLELNASSQQLHEAPDNFRNVALHSGLAGHPALP